MVQRLPTQKNETANKICNTKTPRISARKATATAWRISEDFAMRVSAKPRSAPCRLLRNWICFFAKTTARLIVKLRKSG